MGFHRVLSSLAAFVIASGTFFLLAESKTHWGDAEFLKQLKNSVDQISVVPGSCLSTWDLAFDPCDSLFTQKFTCGLRCDAVVSGWSRVTELSLDHAGYSGTLPQSTWNLPYLQTLDLSINSFSGQIPDSLSNLTRLSRLGLSANSFSGQIPSSIGSLSGLQELYLDSNRLTGSIPASFNGLASLQRLEVQSNNLDGEIPELGSLRSLYYLDASDNAIAGEFPASLPESLVQITMRDNNLTGTLNPEGLRNLEYLEVVDLSSNGITGSVPLALFSLPSLQQLTLSSNQFTSIEANSFGVGPAESGLIALDLSNNRIEGFLPAFMATMPKLSSLSLENNLFTGFIPVEYAVKAVFPANGVSPLERLLLSGNYLLGGIPIPLLGLKPDSANVSLVDNCLYRCPHIFFFCQGGQQKPLDQCKRLIP